jgi:TPR repeat protein
MYRALNRRSGPNKGSIGATFDALLNVAFTPPILMIAPPPVAAHSAPRHLVSLGDSRTCATAASHAQNNLGNLYASGRGVPQDDVKANHWYRRAADQGNAGAQVNLGQSYEFGRGVAADFAEAMKWYRRAADQGSPEGQRRVGLLYAQGHGVSRSEIEAMRWYELAA